MTRHDGRPAVAAARAAVNSWCRRRGIRIAAPAAVVLATAAVAVAPAPAAEIVEREVFSRTADVQAPPMPTGLTQAAGTVVDAASGRVLWSMNPRAVRPIASTTKIMTALIAIARTTPDQRLAATDYRANPVESVLGMRAGERLTADDLLAALLLQSANDAADTFAARLAGSRSAFVATMNKRARALGLSDTRFGNPIGLDQPRTVSSARDLAVLAREAMKNERFRRIVGKRKATLTSGNRTRQIRNRNDLVGRHAFVDGIKTGHTLGAGYVLVGSATKVDARVISVALGTPSMAARNADTLKLLRFGRAFFEPVRALDRDRSFAALPVALQDTTVPVYPRRSSAFALRDGERYAVALRSAEELEGPLSAGTRVGTATVRRNGRVVAQVGVEIRSAIPAPPVTAVLLHQLRRFLPLLAFLGIALMIGVAVLRGRRRQRPPAPEEERITTASTASGEVPGGLQEELGTSAPR